MTDNKITPRWANLSWVCYTTGLKVALCLHTLPKCLVCAIDRIKSYHSNKRGKLTHFKRQSCLRGHFMHLKNFILWANWCVLAGVAD